VGVTQRPQVNFSRAVNAATLNANSFYATGPDGAKLGATVVPALDGSFAWLFFDEPMPGGARVTVHVDGSKIRAAADGTFLDADSDGNAGGELTASFTTVSRTGVAGTRLVGKVVDPGPDLQPMSFDDVRRGPDGIIHTPDDVFLNPIAHAKVYILGQEDRFVFTDANGNFELTDVPAGAVKVAVDGRTATNAPAGVFWPEMVMAAEFSPGVTNTLMSSMGSVEERQANAGRPEVYLPRVATSVLQPVSDTQPTVITVEDAAAAPALSAAERAALTLTVNPGSAIGEDGQPISNAQIGISTVPPELVRDMLPPGVLQHTFDITIQAPGVATFAEPVQITFPNVFNAAPGTKLSILSFDHTTGMLVINGTGTVSADGLTVVSDPDSGIKAPGWHGLTPPGGPSDPPCPPGVPSTMDVPPVPLTAGLQDRFFKDDNGQFTLSFGNNAQKVDPSKDACDPVNMQATPLVVQITVEGPAGEFLEGLSSQTFSLYPQQVKNIQVSVKDLLTAANVNAATANSLYGSKIVIKAWKSTAPATLLLDDSVFVYRFFDIADDNHTDGQVDFPKTYTDGVGAVFNELPYQNKTSPSSQPTYEMVSTGSAIGVNFEYQTTQLRFDPVLITGDRTDTMQVKTPEGNVVGQIGVHGLAVGTQIVKLSKSAFTTAIAAVVDDNGATVTGIAGFLALFPTDGPDVGTSRSDEPGFTTKVDSIYAATVANLDTNFNSVSAKAMEALEILDTSTGAGVNVLFPNYILNGIPNPAGGTSAAAAQWADFGKTKFTTNTGNEANTSKLQEKYLFDAIINRAPTDDMWLNIDRKAQQVEGSPSYETAIAIRFANSLTHEVGHDLGAIHYRDATNEYIDGSIMGNGSQLNNLNSFGPKFDGLIKYALGLPVSDAEFTAAYDYYKTWISFWTWAANNSEPPPDHSDELVGPAFLTVMDAPVQLGQPVPGYVRDVDMGTTQADGVGGAQLTRTLYLNNSGYADVTISKVELIGSSAFSLSGVNGTPIMLPPLDPDNLQPALSEHALTLTYDPSTLGTHSATLRIESNSELNGGVIEIPLTGTAQSPFGDLRIVALNNNVGGQDIDAGARTSTGFATLRNVGASDLSISEIRIGDGVGAYTLADLPAGFGAGNLITLAPGAEMSLSLVFNPSQIGLTRGSIEVLSNDPDSSVTRLRVTGTGIGDLLETLHWGNDYVALETPNRENSQPLRTVNDDAGGWSFFLPSGEALHYVLFDPVSALVMHGYDVSADNGGTTSLIGGQFGASVESDTDGDGLPDDIEFAIGTSLMGTDTDKDGLDDYTEIQQGLDPLGGLSVPTGIVAAVDLQGSAQAVAVTGALDGSGRLTAYVGTGAHGIAIVDVASITAPSILAELDLPGTNADIAVDTVRGIAAVAAREGGLHLVDVSEPQAPVLVQSMALGGSVNSVEIRDGFAYVAAGASIITVDLNTGEPRTTLNLAPQGVTSLVDLKFDGDTLYSLDNTHTLRSIQVASIALTLRDALTLPDDGGKLFVGNGVAYIGAGDGSGSAGHVTVDVSDPDNLALLSGVDDNAVAGTAIALNGSGLAVGVGSNNFVFGAFKALDVLSAADPTNTGNFITRIALPAAPSDLALAGGLAFVADGTSGLQIVNYVGFDTQGAAPSVSIAVDGVDVDPGTPGVQVLEGRTVRVIPTISDDVQVRNVDLLVNGQVVSSDVSFPWELFAQAPTIASGGDTLSIQVRATDTGGNVGLSNQVLLGVVPDTFPPQVASVSIDEGARLFFVRSIDIAFDEPLDLARLNPSGVRLTRAGADGTFDTADDVTENVRLDTRNFGQSLSAVVEDLLPAGEYRFALDAAIIADRAGNPLPAPVVRHFTIRPASDVKAVSGVSEIPTAPSANPGQRIGITVPFVPANARGEFKVVDASGNVTTRVLTPVRVDAAGGIAYFAVPLDAVTGDAVVYSLVNGVRTDFLDGTFLLQVVPVITDVQVESVAGDGSSATVLISGLGFVEGGNSEYRFGGESVLDAGVNTGPDVFSNGAVRVTVPLSANAFGPISVKSAGGTSAAYSVSLSSITATALSGTPANAGEASANAGQAVMLNGTGLSTATDVLLRYVDVSGTLQMVRLSPSAAAADGTSATLLIPAYANGAFTLQVFGSASQPLLQIVPTLTEFDIQDRTVLFGSGFVEGATSYSFAGASVVDSAADANTNNIDVYYAANFSTQNGSAYLNRNALPSYGMGEVSISTAGGISAPLALNTIRVSAAGTSLSDVAVDGAGKLWVSDYNNPGHLLKIDPATGQTLQSITLTNGFGTPYTFSLAGLQVLAAPMTLGATSVPAGSLLVFNGYVANDRVIAVNALTGAVIASLTLDGNYDLTAGVFDAATGRLFITENNGPGNRIIELSPTTGAQLSVLSAPFNVQSWAGLAIDPTTGHLWLGSVNGGPQVVEYQIGAGGTLSELRRVDTRAQGLNENEISGLSFDASGALYASSTQGQIYRIDTALDGAAIPTATLSQVIATNIDGVAADANQAAANVGQVIELRGTNFGAGTRVLFNTRDDQGNTDVVSVTPLTISGDGTRLQALVPDLATTGDVRVVNQGSRDLGFGGYNDAVYRNVTVNFTAGSSNAVIRFSDGGLQVISDESWGIDNVVVRQGGSTVFADDFESGAAANWSNGTVNSDAIATFSRFSGRFSSASQTLNLIGLSAGQNYTLSFDLLVLDSWDGADPSAGPDLIDVSVDGVSVLRETLANYPDVDRVQSFRASAGIRLQIVPTLTGVSGLPGNNTQFTLQGSGFMDGASTLTIGGIVVNDTANNLSPFDVTGSRNSSMNAVTNNTLDGPVRISTEGGYAQIAGPAIPAQPVVQFTGIVAGAVSGVPGDVNVASANTGQNIVLQGQGFTSNTLVQFEGVDDTGALGTITRTGTVGASGTTLTLAVPALAKSGKVTVLGSNTSFDLQVVPTLRAMGGTVAAGNTIVLEGTGLTPNDLAISIDGRGVGNFSVRTLINGGSTDPDQQLLTLTVPNGVGAGVITLSTLGGSASLRTGVSLAVQAALNPAADVGDTLATAEVLALGSDQKISVSSSVVSVTGGDADLYRVTLGTHERLRIDYDGTFSARLRIFDAAGAELGVLSASSNTSSTVGVLNFTAPSAGLYYVGVSGSSNTAYNPNVANSGANSGTGSYTLNLERQREGSTGLSGIQAAAASGTATHAGIASANTGQSIVLTGTGLVSTDRVVFSVIDSNGTLSTQVVTPTNVDVANQTISVVVPNAATTGRVRLERDQVGLLLQIVPTLSDVTMNAGSTFTGGALTLSGSGFAEGAMAVVFGAQRVEDISPSFGLNVFTQSSGNDRVQLTVPSAVVSGPIRVSTVGGTSAAFGLSLSSITASAASGIANNAGQASANPGQAITLNGVGLDASLDIVFQTIDASGNRNERIVRPVTVDAGGTQAQVVVPVDAVSGTVRVVGDVNGTAVALQVVPVITDVQVESVAGDGSSATVLISGLGFVEGGNSEYRFGGESVLDAGVNTGPDVFSNGAVRVTVPLSANAFGPISVKSAGGTSAAYSVSLSSITATALSGTPANAGEASANAGQAVMLNGTGLSTATDVLLRYVDVSGTLQMVRLSPSAAAADGTSATLLIPAYANGAFTLQVFGSASQPLLQIVPTLTEFDIQDRTVLFGSGFVEGATSYSFAGASVVDSAADANTNNIDVYYAANFSTQNGSAYLNRNALPSYGMGEVSISTAGGISAPLALNTIRVSAAGTSLSDVAVDGAGKLWVSDYNNPGHLLKIDPATGQTLQSITLTNGFGTPYTFSLAGLQVLAAPMTLGATSVPAGSLLVFNGYVANDRVIAVNALTGAVIASLTLDGNYDLTAGVFDAATGRLFITENNGPGNRIIELSPTTGAQLSVLSAPFNVQSWAGLAIDPTTGHLWLGSVNGGPQVVEYQIGAGGTLSELRRVDTRAQGLNENEISGLSFDASGALYASSTQGQIYRIDTGV
jgi:hypothetical protein